MTPKLYTALRWGAILGGVLAIAETAAYFLLIRAAADDPVAAQQWFVSTFMILGVGEMVLEWLVPLGAGFLAARETGETSSGLVAGLTSGVVVAVVSLAGALVVTTPPGLVPDDPTAFDPVAAALVATLLTLASGAVGGWLGGRWALSARGPRRQQ